MDVRRPLHALPLACFLPLADNPPPRISPLKSSTKRSRSPSIMLSPAKRRILYQEGYLPSSSLEAKINATRDKSVKGDNSLRGRLRPRAVPTNRDEPRYTKVELPFDNAVADRPRSLVSSTSDAIVCSTPSGSSTGSCYPGGPHGNSHCPGAYQRAAPPLMVPREIPPRPDPQSQHYPGFDIYYDTHIELPSTSSRFKTDANFAKDDDDVKENLPMKQLTKKFASVLVEDGPTPTPTPSQVETCNDKPRVASLPTTPFRKRRFPGSAASLDVRSNSKTAGLHGFTPGRTPGSVLSKLISKQTLKDEVDDACSDDEGM